MVSNSLLVPSHAAPNTGRQTHFLPLTLFAMKYSDEKRARALKYIVEEGLGFSKVAKVTGISRTTLSRWTREQRKKEAIVAVTPGEAKVPTANVKDQLKDIESRIVSLEANMANKVTFDYISNWRSEVERSVRSQATEQSTKQVFKTVTIFTTIASIAITVIGAVGALLGYGALKVGLEEFVAGSPDMEGIRQENLRLFRESLSESLDGAQKESGDLMQDSASKLREQLKGSGNEFRNEIQRASEDALRVTLERLDREIEEKTTDLAGHLALMKRLADQRLAELDREQDSNSDKPLARRNPRFSVNIRLTEIEVIEIKASKAQVIAFATAFSDESGLQCHLIDIATIRQGQVWIDGIDLFFLDNAGPRVILELSLFDNDAPFWKARNLADAKIPCELTSQESGIEAMSRIHDEARIQFKSNNIGLNVQMESVARKMGGVQTKYRGNRVQTVNVEFDWGGPTDVF